MKLRLLIAALTILVFAAGFGACLWTQRYCPLLPPPIGALDEIRGRRFDIRLPATGPTSIAQINAEIEHLKPEIDAFRHKFDTLNDEFRRKLDALLTPAQHDLFVKMRKRYDDRHAHHAGGPPPTVEASPSGGATLRLPFLFEPIEGMTSVVVVPLTLDHLAGELQLDDRQKTAVHQLLLDRREKFLALIDSTPPPSIRLMRLAPLVNQLGGPPPPPPPQ
ncbi:MAG: hypothetical protein ABSE59_02670 [Opitutaceae bacterium]|jgi:hypothetical protein